MALEILRLANAEKTATLHDKIMTVMSIDSSRANRGVALAEVLAVLAVDAAGTDAARDAIQELVSVAYFYIDRMPHFPPPSD